MSVVIYWIEQLWYMVPSESHSPKGSRFHNYHFIIPTRGFKRLRQAIFIDFWKERM